MVSRRKTTKARVTSKALTVAQQPGTVEPNDFSLAVARSLRRAGKEARGVARMHGTPIYVLKNGKIVAEKP